MTGYVINFSYAICPHCESPYTERVEKFATNPDTGKEYLEMEFKECNLCHETFDYKYPESEDWTE